jgi:hypothetical protein
MGDIFTGYLGTCVMQLGFAKLLLNAALRNGPSERIFQGMRMAGVPEGDVGDGWSDSDIAT